MDQYNMPCITELKPDRKRLADPQMLTLIRAIHAELKGAYGSPRMVRELRARGFSASKERVERLAVDAYRCHRPQWPKFSPMENYCDRQLGDRLAAIEDAIVIRRECVGYGSTWGSQLRTPAWADSAPLAA